VSDTDQTTGDRPLHGEYKTPGGKLVVVDFAVEGDVLARVQVSGDFFVYPEDAFDALAPALEGAGADLSESELADRVRFGLPRGAELLGTSPEAIGAAVRRAIAAGPAAGAEGGTGGGG
jgi:lipoate---protein ligase